MTCTDLTERPAASRSAASLPAALAAPALRYFHVLRDGKDICCQQPGLRVSQRDHRTSSRFKIPTMTPSAPSSKASCSTMLTTLRSSPTSTPSEGSRGRGITGKTVLKFAGYDDDTTAQYNTITYQTSIAPSTAADMFDVTPAKGEVVVKSALDYETQPKVITMYVTATDGYCFVRDVTITPDWQVSEPDAGDIVKFTDIQVNDKGYFQIDEDTEKRVRVLEPRLLDGRDRAGHRLRHRPRLVLRAEQHLLLLRIRGRGRSSTIRPCRPHRDLSAGTVVTFPVYATDQGKTPGPLTSVSPTWVSIYTMPCITPSPVPKVTDPPVANTTNATVSYFNISSPMGTNLPWIILAAILAALLTALLLYMCIRYCWPCLRRCCTRCTRCTRKPKARLNRPITPTRRPTPVAQPEKPHPGFIFGWWKETYANDDYKTTPDRTNIPEPSKGPEIPETNTYDVDPVLTPPPPDPPQEKTSDCYLFLCETEMEDNTRRQMSSLTDDLQDSAVLMFYYISQVTSGKTKERNVVTTYYVDR
ncbi:hypothetical protein C0Q70_07210 [Pomacea canaliculata]|uniref:Cadherin domain-containing protein n=1 Tax=Pomacea canaliculata TaxID=400727 RepID=A0A2T7PEE0_POMCA|nr:hypothetical protein C0Q70_07210 [Pomacea canaliculata]